MANPHVLSWVNPTLNTDGTAYAQTSNAGYELSLDGTAAVAVPLAWATSFDMSTLAAFDALKSGTHTVTLANVTTAGIVGVASAPLSFSIAATPDAPTGLAIV